MTVYLYPDARGRVLLKKTRYYKAPEPTWDVPFPMPEKRFSLEARRGEANAWVSRPSSLMRKHPGLGEHLHGLLYGLPELLAALARRDHGTVYWTEGEKDCDTLRSLGLPDVVGVSHWQGGGLATEQQAQRLAAWRGEVVVVADMDERGALCAWRRYRLLLGVGLPAERLSVVRAAGPFDMDGRDLTDHLDAGHALAELVPVDLQKLEKACARIEQTPTRDRSGSDAWKK